MMKARKTREKFICFDQGLVMILSSSGVEGLAAHLERGAPCSHGVSRAGKVTLVPRRSSNVLFQFFINMLHIHHNICVYYINNLQSFHWD